MPRFYGSRFAPPIPQLLLTLRQAEFAYLSGVTDPAQYVVAADLLLWLVTVTTPPDGSNADPDRQQILARATALIAQLNGRLDFYGQPTTHVPLASLAYYSDTLPGELASATAVETTYDTYVAAVQDQAQQRAQLNAMLDADSARLTALESQLQPLLDQITAYEAAVSVLQLARNEQGVIFANAEKVWEGAVISQLADDAASAQCKSYEQILTTVGNVVTIEDPADLEEISVTLDVKKIDYGTIEKIGNGVIDWQNAVTRLDAAQGDIASVVDAANAIGSDALAGDSGKIAVDRAVFAEKLLPYKKIDATGELEAQLNIYLARAQAFSQKQIEYNALQIQAKNLTATIAQGRDQLMQVQNQLSEASDPTIAVYKAYMARTYGEVLDRTIRDVYGVRQAFRYWALEDFAFPPNDGVWDMTYLNGIQATLTGRVTSEINDYHGTGANNAEKFDYRTAEGAGWIIDDARSLDTLRTTGTLDFSIPIDDPWVAKNFGGMAQVVATDYTLELHGVTVPSGDLMVRLTHNGVAQFIDPNGKPWLFTHVPVATSYRYSLGDGSWLAGGSLGNADISIGLSPFTSWRLTVLKEPDNPGLDLSGATRLVLKFAGGFRSSAQRR
jgi:predicted  nucleic acid-binding Zn-ribbon protein